MKLFLIIGFFILASCNRPDQNSSEQIANGNVFSADYADVKGNPASYTVALNKVPDNDPSKLKMYCSGVLIHPRIVLTAAHCSARNGDIVIKIDKEGKPDARLIRNVRPNEIFTKLAANGMTDIAISNDFALLLLDKEYLNVSEILPRSEPLARGKMLVSGFGRNEAQIIDYQLRHTLLEISDLILPPDAQGFGYINVINMPNISVCDGDSGGPAMINGVLVAITSTGKKGALCGESPSSKHASVWHGMPWISQNVNLLLGNPSDSILPDQTSNLPEALPGPAPIVKYVSFPPSRACQTAVGVFDVIPRSITNSKGEPGFVCDDDGNPLTPGRIIQCTSSSDPASCKDTGY
jgi:hypothetical protein